MAKQISTMEKDVASLMGLPIEEVKNMSPLMIRNHIENMREEKMSFSSAFPIIGRGSVIRDFTTTEELDAEIDAILKND